MEGRSGRGRVVVGRARRATGEPREDALVPLSTCKQGVSLFFFLPPPSARYPCPSSSFAPLPLARRYYSALCLLHSSARGAPALPSSSSAGTARLEPSAKRVRPIMSLRARGSNPSTQSRLLPSSLLTSRLHHARALSYWHYYYLHLSARVHTTHFPCTLGTLSSILYDDRPAGLVAHEQNGTPPLGRGSFSLSLSLFFLSLEAAGL